MMVIPETRRAHLIYVSIALVKENCTDDISTSYQYRIICSTSYFIEMSRKLHHTHTTLVVYMDILCTMSCKVFDLERKNFLPDHLL